MKHAIAAAALCALAGCAESATPDTATSVSTPDRSADEAAIRSIAETVVTAWNEKDSALLASVFAPQHDYVAVNGQMFLDWTPAENASTHEQVWQFAFPEGSKIGMEVKAIDFPAPDVAVAQVANRNDYVENGTPQMLTSWLTAVMVRMDGSWKIIAFNNNRGDGRGAVDDSGGPPGAPPAEQ